MKTALLVVDMQISLIDEGPWNSEALMSKVEKLIELARLNSVLVVFVVDHRVEPNMSLHPRMQTISGDLHITKHFCDSFLDTPLDEELQIRGIKHLVIAGLQTDYCIDTTCRRAASLGYTVQLASDAHSTFPHHDLNAEQIIAHHNWTLRHFSAGKGSVSAVKSEHIHFA
ncbi:isochorismatase family protein [Geothrix sp.]|jgi:nicotinamidase-related amidase|uniref:isochorismatase family protein n=1 Tax=Geothrix sp. TaxID=1962974 RepID=UPI0025C16FD0|nr:isochorismatase family protein [Geothrix sp.]